MFARILLPLDGSEVAEMALPYGEELAGRLGAELVLYHVHEAEYEQMQHMHQVYLDRLAKTAEGNIRNQSRSAEAKVTTMIESGEPTASIRNLVAKNEVDLIIMTSVSASGLKLGKKLGSVADYVCRTVPVPIMLIRPQNVPQIDAARRLINHILITLDGSDLSKLALPVGEELACELHVRATIFQMANMLHIYAGKAGAHVKLDEDEKKRVDTEMLRIETELKGKGLDVTHIVTPGFDAASEIIDLSKKMGIDLVVMSTKGRTGLDRWFFGSVTEKVLRYGETPLLLVPARS